MYAMCLLVAAAWWGSAASLELPPQGEIPLTIQEPAGVARTRAPVTSGICLPRGLVAADRRFGLFDGEREIPLQTTPLVVERDGTLRWVLLDFQTDVGASAKKELTLRVLPAGAKTASPADALAIVEDADGVTVSTGPLVFKVAARTPFVPLASASVGGVPIVTGGACEFVDGKNGRRFTAGVPSKLAWEYRGPVRATLRVDGVYVPEGGGEAMPTLGYTTRITAWAGSTQLRIEHILANSNSERVIHWSIARAALAFDHALGAEGETVAAGDVASPPRKTEKESGGWIARRSAKGGIALCDRDFRGDPPRRLLADGARLTAEYVSGKSGAGEKAPFRSEHFLLYDLSHKTAELWLDLAAGNEPDALAAGARGRLMAFAPPEWYAECNVLGVGRFGTLEDEKRVYGAWRWKFDERRVPRMAPQPHAFVQWEDNHYESEADSPEGLLLMALRTGERGYFDLGEAWARYHANMHAWRSDGWVYDDGAIWFPQGGPLGTRPARAQPARDYEKWDKGTGEDKELWHLVQAKACYCHFYGAGLIDHFLLTGNRDDLEAALDLVEQKNSEFRKHRQFTPGKTTIDDTRGFGRGFYVITHVLEAVPANAFVADLARLCRDVLWRAPDLDARGFAPCHIGTGFGGFDLKNDLPSEMAAFMAKEGITIDANGRLTDKTGARWPVVCLGGTWQHAYVQAAAARYAEVFGDEDMADFAEAFGRFAAKSLLSEKCKQTHYYAYMDVPRKGEAWDPWKFQPAHVATKDGEGCVHSGWYTCFFPDAIAAAYELSGDGALLERAREFWHRGSKREYETKSYSAGADAVGKFADHHPPKDDTVLSTSRMFYAWAHPRGDSEPPDPIRDLAVERTAGGRAIVRFTAPRDRGGEKSIRYRADRIVTPDGRSFGKTVRYRVKCAPLPIVEYDDFDFARDDGRTCPFWKAVNVEGEPPPAASGTREEFEVRGVPDEAVLYFVVASEDDSCNRSRLSPAAEARRPAAQARPAVRPPNVVFILADDLGWRDTSFTGSTYYETPHVERLARRGMYFPNAYSASPLCSPTRASIMTGLSPARIGITAPVCHVEAETLRASVQKSAAAHVRTLGCESATRLAHEHFTLAEALKAAGYATGHFGKWHLGREPYDPLHQGFDVDVPHWPGPGPAGSYVAPWKFPGFKERTPGEHIEDRMGDEAVAFMEANRERPFFLNYWQFSVHAPFDAKADLIARARAKADPRNPQHSPTYAAMVKSFDDNVGKILEALDRLGLTEHTIVVLCSDNGGNMYNEIDGTTPTSNAPLRGGKATVYEGGIRVPCIVSWPGTTVAGSRNDAIVQSVDFYPTILELTGIAPRPGQLFDGISIAPALRGGDLAREEVFVFFPHSPRVPESLPPSVCVRRGDWKLIRVFHDGPERGHRYELYNLIDDMGERVNLAEKEPERVRALDARIERFLADTKAVLPVPNPRWRPDARESVGLWREGGNGHAALSLAEGALQIGVSGNDPQITTDVGLGLPAGAYVLEFRMRSAAAGNGQAFCAGPLKRVVPGTGVAFPVAHDGQWHEHRVRLHAPQGIHLLRLDPCAGKGETAIAWMRLRDDADKLLKEWTFGGGDGASTR